VNRTRFKSSRMVLPFVVSCERTMIDGSEKAKNAKMPGTKKQQIQS
jgi:hypothetical protein